MRVIVLALAVALVAGAQDSVAPDFAKGKTYVYTYEARLLGGLPEEGLGRAGMKIHAKVFIHKANDFIFVKLSDYEIFEYSGIWPKDSFVPVKLPAALVAQLTFPIKCEYSRGIVGRIFAPASVSATVLNIYRGIFNMLHINMKRNTNIYDLHEPGTQGVCKTHYIINEDRKTERIMLMKSRDLAYCRERIQKSLGLAYTNRCPECETAGRSLKGVSMFNYVMKPTPDGSLIMMANVEELVQFSPFNILNGAAQMESRQMLKFLEVQKTPLDPGRAGYLPRGSVQYEFSSELLHMPIHLLKITNAETQIVEILNHLVNFNVAKVHEDAPLKFIELIQVLRMARFETVEKIWSAYKDRKDYRNWILHAVPAIGTHIAVNFLKEKFFADELTSAEAIQGLMASVHLVTADLETIRLFEGLMREERILKNFVLRGVVILGYGTLVSKYCVENPSCPDELMKPVHDFISHIMAKDGAEDKLITAVKALGNAGHPISLKLLMKLIPFISAGAARLPHRVHIEAVLALRNIAKREPKRVQEIALHLFTQKDAHAELRIAAVIVLFETKLPLSLVTSLAKGLLDEQNMQVASFVYSYMKAMTKSTSPDNASLVSACNVAMTILGSKYDRMKYSYSRAFYLDTYSNPWMMGAAMSAFYINEAATILPKAVMTKMRTYLAGTYADVLEIGVRTEGIQEALLKMEDQNNHRIDTIKQIVQAFAGWKASPSNQPLASFYVKLFGQEVAFASIDRAVIDQMIEFASGPKVASYGRNALEALLSGFKMHMIKPMLVAEMRHIFPTTIGLPMELSFYKAAVAAASVECQSTVTPPLPRDFHLSQLLKSDVKMKAAIAPSMSIYTYVVMGINTAFLQATLMSKGRVYTNIPAEIQAKINMVKGNFKFEFLPVEGVDKIASAQVDTYAVARNIEDLAAAKMTPMVPNHINLEMQKYSSHMASSMTASRSSAMVSSSELILNQNQIIKGYETKVCKELESLGIKACTEIESHNAAFIRNTLLYNIIGRHLVVVRVARISGPVIENIEVEIQVGEGAAEKVLRRVSLSEEEDDLEDKTVLMKLQKILTPNLRNTSSSSSSSSQSSSSQTKSMVDKNGAVRKNSQQRLKSSSSSAPSASSSSSSSSSSKRSSKSRSKSSSSSSSRSGSSSSSSSSSSSRSSSSSSSKKGSSKGSKSKRSSSSSSSSSSSQHGIHSSSSSSSRHSRPSSSSSSMSKVDQADNFEMTFTKNQRNPNSQSQHGKSSSSSYETIFNKARYLANTMSPSVTILIRAVRSDHKRQGYQITAYIDKENRRVRIILTNLAEHENWRICADAVVLSSHKMTASLVWGLKCKQYSTVLTAETGHVDQEPAIRVKMNWKRIPRYMHHIATRIYSFMGHSRRDIGIRVKKAKNAQKQVTISVAVGSKNSLSFQLQTPRRTISKRDALLPFYLPVGKTAAEVQAYHDNWLDKLTCILSKSYAAECTLHKNRIITFNHQKLETEWPHSCTQVLAQDCSKDLKFMVLLKWDHVNNRHRINVKVADLNIEMYNNNNAVELRINGMVVQISNQIYHNPTGQIHISQMDQGLVLHAASYGLQEIFYDPKVLKIQIVDWMKGQTCGLCGRADGEIKQEYSTPSGRVSKSAVSYAHSWVQSASSCRDTSGCLMKHESVKLEKQILIEGEESKCYSVEPVLRCLPGCMPVRTTQVEVGFHCVPADTNMNRSTMRGMFEKSIDVMETAEAHLACRCTAQCS